MSEGKTRNNLEALRVAVSSMLAALAPSMVGGQTTAQRIYDELHRDWRMTGPYPDDEDESRLKRQRLRANP